MKRSKIKVCQVVHGIVGGGSEQVILNYCSRMKDIQFDMLFQYEPNPQILERFQEANINCIQVPDKVHHPIKHIWAMYRQFKTGQYNVVHSLLDWYRNSCACLLAMGPAPDGCGAGDGPPARLGPGRARGGGGET